QGAVGVSSADPGGATLASLIMSAGASVTGGANITLIGTTLRGAGLTLDGGSGAQIVHNVIEVSGAATGLTLAGGTANAVVEHNAITGGARGMAATGTGATNIRSEEHTSELQSRVDLVCRLLLEKKKK